MQKNHMDMAGIEFGLIFFASSETSDSRDKYRLVIESAKFADQHCFSSIWIPERHFTRDGWLYPNPAVLQAAIARETQHIHLRAGSVVLPLHNPIRVAEEWAMVDNLSGGRVGLSFASGWHPDDFVLFPEHYAERNEEMYRGIQTVQKLWRGETLQVKGGDGNLVEIRTYPTPVQPVLPTWITAAGNPKTFMRAGEIGANLLTHLYNHGIEELAERIQLYREARASHGYDPETGQISVMLHTFVWERADTVLDQAKATFCDYLKSASYLLNAIAHSRGQKIDLASLSEQDIKDYLDFVFNRLISTQRVLFGTPETCLEAVARLKAIGVTEIACQMDFGLDTELVLRSLQYVNRLKELSRAGAPLQPPSPPSFPSLADHSNVPQDNHSNGAHPSQSKGSPVSTGSQQAGLLRSIQERCREDVSLSQFYNRLTSHGVQLASSFQGIEQLWRRDGEALGKIQIPRALEQETDAYQIHPALLDACFQVLIAALPANVSTARSGEEEALYLPTGLRSFRMHHQPGKNVWSHAVLRSGTLQDADMFEGDVHLLDAEGQVLVEALGLRLQQFQRSEGTGRSLQQATQVDQFCYEIRWETASLEHAARFPHDAGWGGDGTWLIFMDSSGVGQRLAHLLTARGDSCIKVFPGYTYQALQRVEYSVNPAYPEHIQRVINDALATNSDGLDKLPRRGVIHLWSLDATSTEETSGATLERDQALGTGSALSAVQALVNTQGTTQGTLQTRLWFVTRGAQPVSAEGTDAFRLSVAQSPLWGLGKTIAIEHPELWGGLVDVDPLENVDTIATQLLTILSHQHGENQVAFRQGQSYVARLVRSSNRSRQPRQNWTIRADASYLITGGLWGLGFEVARWMAKKGAQHLVLLGRTQFPPRTEWDSVEADSRLARQIAGIRELEGLGVHVHYASVDVTDEQQLASFLQNFRNRSQQYPPIRGIMHAASVWQDEQGQSLVRPLIHLDQDAVRAVFRPKVTGSWHLHKLFQDTRLDFFVLFSSGASLLGSAAQGNYAAAGAFLDVLAHYLRATGQPALSIDWGAVSEAGFGATQEGLRVHEYWESHGIQRITPQQVLDALELLIPQDVSQIGVLKLDWHLLQQFYPQLAELPLFTHLATDTEAGSARGTSTQRDTTGYVTGSIQSSLLQKLPSVGQEERQQLVESYLSEKVASVLRLPASGMDVQQPLTTLGLDSLMAIELKNKIELELSVHIPIVTFLRGPSIRQFATQLLSQLGKVAELAGASPILPVQVMIPMEELHQTTQELEVYHNNLTSRLDQEAPSRATNDSEAPHIGAQRIAPNVEGHDGLLFYHGIHGLSQQESAQLLANIEQLSDSEVDALLHRIVQEEGLNQ